MRMFIAAALAILVGTGAVAADYTPAPGKTQLKLAYSIPVHHCGPFVCPGSPASAENWCISPYVCDCRCVNGKVPSCGCRQY
jgi:hypothetical protein